MPSSESKGETFRRLASQRTNTVLDRLRILGHCSSPHLDEYTEEDVKKMFRAIEKEVKTVKAKFIASNKSDFHL